METREMLEEQVQRARKRSDQALALETEIIKYKQQMNDMALVSFIQSLLRGPYYEVYALFRKFRIKKIETL